MVPGQEGLRPLWVRTGRVCAGDVGIGTRKEDAMSLPERRDMRLRFTELFE